MSRSRRLVTSAAAVLPLALVACAQNSFGCGCPVPGPPSPGFVVADSAALTPSAGSYDEVVLYASTFADPFHQAVTVRLIDPNEMGVAVPATFTVANPAFAIDPVSPPPVSATPGPNAHVLVAPAAGGVTTVTARIADGETAGITAVAYPTLQLGCDFRAIAAASFDPETAGSPPTRNADVYVVEPTGTHPALDPCATGFTDPTVTEDVYHFPHGATLATDGDYGHDVSAPGAGIAPGAQRTDVFPSITTATWRNDFTSISTSALAADLAPCGAQATSCSTEPARVLLFKTAAGRVVKFDVVRSGESLLGPYEVGAPSGGPFPY